MNVLITAPSLDVNKNVSGIAAVVNTIIDNNKSNTYVHFLEGREDGATGILNRVLTIGKSYFQLANILYKQQINLVHLNLPLNPPSIIREFLAFSIVRLFGKKVLLHLHGGRFLLQKPVNPMLKAMIQSMYVRSHSIVCLSSLEKESLKKEYALNEVMVLENTVDASFGKLERQIRTSQQLTVLFMGRLHASKGIEIILEAVRMLAIKGTTGVQFIFCGMGPLLPDVLQMEQAYPDQVTYMGIVSGAQKTDILMKAQVFILPSLYGEGLPVALLEAMAAGLVPVVTSDGSMGSVVTTNETGILVEKNNSAPLVRALELLHRQPAELKRMARNARAATLDRFSVQKYVYSLNQLYSKSVA